MVGKTQYCFKTGLDDYQIRFQHILQTKRVTTSQDSERGNPLVTRLLKNALP
jgi:hypothetical protein